MAVYRSVSLCGSYRNAGLCLVAVLLAGCAETPGFSLFQSADSKERDVTVSDRAVPLIERDVEAPDVFQVTDRGLWDGRPSLGGIWVAHPDVDKPERVIIRNTENSEFVIGALFRRERETPGPVLMVSSDAAAELGMLAGAPAQLNVTALRREETPDPQAEAEAAAAAEVAEETEATAAGTQATLAALPLGTSEPSAGAASTSASAATTAATSSSATIASAAAAISAAEADSIDGANATPDGVIAATDPASEIDDSEKTFLQIGIFSQPSHAERTANVMLSAGMEPEIKTDIAKGRTFWRVVVGPAANIDDRTSMLDVIRGEGFVDAFPVVD